MSSYFEGKYTVSQVVMPAGETTSTITKAMYDEFIAKETPTMEEQMAIEMCAMFFGMEIELKDDKTAKITTR